MDIDLHQPWVTGFAGYRWFRLDLTMRDRNTLQNELFAGVHYQLQ
jgi:hypothetical protein